MTRDEWNEAYAAEAHKRLEFTRVMADVDNDGFEDYPDDPIQALSDELTYWSNDE